MEIIATGGETHVKVWDIASGNLIAELEGHTRSVYCVCFSPCGAMLATASHDKTVIVWYCHTWERRISFALEAPVSSVTFSSHSDRILSTSLDGFMRVWDLSTSQELLFIESGLECMCSACFNFNGDLIAVTCMNTAAIYDAYTGELKHNLCGHEDIVQSVRFSRDGCLLVSGSDDGTAIIWNVESLSVVHILKGHRDSILDACFDNVGSRVISCSLDERARIWDVLTGTCLVILSGHNGTLNSCCFSQDGCKAVTGGDRGLLEVWCSHTGEELKTIKEATHDRFRAILTVASCSSEIGAYI